MAEYTRKDVKERIRHTRDLVAGELLESMQADLDEAHDCLSMLSKNELGKWYSGKSVTDGYYAGFDDGEYAIKQTLTRLARWR
jgi:hypothetical protein